MSRRQLRVVTAWCTALLGLGALAACGSDEPGSRAAGDKPFAGQTLIVGGPASDFIEIESELVDPVFERETGAEIQWVPSDEATSLAKLLASRGGKPPYDVVYLGTVTQRAAAEAGVIQELDYPSLLTNADEYPDIAYSNPGYAPAYTYARVGICVNKEKYDEAGIQLPTDYRGWFDPAVKGHVLFPAAGHAVWTAIIPAYASTIGASIDDPQPVVDELATIDPQALFTSSGDAQQALASGDAWMVAAFNEGRCRDAAPGMEFLPLHLTVDGTEYPYLALADSYDVVTGTDKQELAIKFIDISNEYSAIADAQITGWIPMRQDVVPKAIERFPEAKEIIEQSDPGTFYISAYPDFQENLQEWTKAFNEAMS